MIKRALAAGLALLALAPAVALADPCDDQLTACLQGSDLAVPMQAELITAFVPVRDTPEALALYRQLIPRPYSMPDEPAVGVYASKLDIPFRIPGNPEGNYSSWFEDGIDIRVEHQGETGWYRLAVPLSSPFEWEIGRAAGFPKIMAEAGREDIGGGHRMWARSDGQTMVDLAWEPAGGAVAPSLRSYTLNRDPVFLLMDPLAGPAASRYRFVVKPIVPAGDFGAPAATQVAPVTALPEPQAGPVRYCLGADLAAFARADGLPDVFPGDSTLADLVALEGVVAGAYWDSPEELLILREEDLGEGGY